MGESSKLVPKISTQMMRTEHTIKTAAVVVGFFFGIDFCCRQHSACRNKMNHFNELSQRINLINELDNLL